MTIAAIPVGPLPDDPEIDRMMAIVYACIHARQDRKPVSDIWLVTRGLLKAARAMDGATADELLLALAAAIGEIIADLGPSQQQALIEDLIHRTFQFSGQLRTPGFDQAHGITGHG